MKVYFALISASFISLLLTLSDCSKRTPAEYHLSGYFERMVESRLDSSRKANFCDIIDSDWDSIIVVKPYAKLANQRVLQDLENSTATISLIKDIERTDSHCYLVFVEKANAIGYAKASRSPVDLALINVVSRLNPDVTVLKWIDCERLYIKSTGQIYSLVMDSVVHSQIRE